MLIDIQKPNLDSDSVERDIENIEKFRVHPAFANFLSLKD